VPVIATIGSDRTGQAYNINADTVAGAIAESLGAEKLVFLTDVTGILSNSADPTTLLHRLCAEELDAMVASARSPKACAQGGCMHPRRQARCGQRSRARRTGHPCDPAGAATSEGVADMWSNNERESDLAHAHGDVRARAGPFCLWTGTELFDGVGGQRTIAVGLGNESARDGAIAQQARGSCQYRTCFTTSSTSVSPVPGPPCR